MRMLRLFFCLLFFPIFAAAQQAPVPPTLDAKAWLLVEYASGQTLAAQNPDERLEPASLTKLMTAYLVFAAIRQGSLKLDQSIMVSEKAWRSQGSRMFLRVNTQVPVEDLIKGMIVQSGNDASVALAEAVAGSEENFAQKMNEEAKRLGMTGSSFRNAAGMPDPQHYTTASDLARLTMALLRDFPEEYAKYYSLKEFHYNKITQPNRNRLLWLDPSVDGVKTGHTDAAGYCLISSAKRDSRRLIAIVLGTASEKVRERESLKLLNFGFQAYEAVKLQAKGEPLATPRLWKGAQNSVKAGFADEFVVAVPRGLAQKLTSEFVPQKPLVAPVTQGQTVGVLKVSLDGKPYGEYAVAAQESVEPAGFFGRLIDAILLWFQ